MKILVTGGSGFIGTRLIDNLLENNHEVLIYDKVESIKYKDLTYIGDVRDRNTLIEACKGVDIIYNLAAEHADDVSPKSLYADVNIGGATNIVEAAKINNIKKIIFTSSVAIYGLNKGTPNESTPAEPFNEYGRTKYEAEKIFIDWCNQDYDNSLTILRPAVIFGERNRGNVYNLINQIISGKFLMVGDGTNHKSMGYVGNIAKFLEMQVNSENGINIFNFADKPDLSSNEIVTIVRNEMNITKEFLRIPYSVGLLGGYSFDLLAFLSQKKFSISSIRIKKFCAETTVDTDRLKLTGFISPFTLEEGIKNMINYEFKK